MMKKFVYAVLMLLYIGFSVVIIIHASNWMKDINFSLTASKARDMAILAAKNFRISNSEVAELEKLSYLALHQHPVNTRLADMFNDSTGFKDIRYVYIDVKLDDDQVKYHVTEQNKGYFGAEVGTPLNLMWLVDVVIGRSIQEIIAEDPGVYDDVRRYSYIRPSIAAVFAEKKPDYEILKDEYGSVISGMAPLYTEEGDFLGLLCVDIYIEGFERTDSIIKLLLLIVLLLPSIVLTAIYITLYIINLRSTNKTAYTDPLTSVKNRRYMEKFLPPTIKDHYNKQHPLSVIMIDIDHFKAYNDNYGHQQGDKVLIEVTRAISSVLREKMDTICRYGGEEFIVILTNTKIPDAEKIAGRIKLAVNSAGIKHGYSGVSDVVTISQGVYSAVPLNTDSEKTFIEYADKALYEAKNTGRNKYIFFTPDLIDRKAEEI